MLELTLTLLAGFAVLTTYVIFGDEIRAKRSKQKTALKPSVSTKAPGKPVAKATKPVSPPVVKPSASQSKPLKPTSAKDPKSDMSSAILACLSRNGPLTLAKLTKELKTDEATLQFAVEKLINDQKAVSIKRGGHPALALYQ